MATQRARDLSVKAYGPSDWKEAHVVHNLTALRRSVEASRAYGARFALLNMPEHGARHDAQPSMHGRYLSRIRAWAQRHGVPFIDVTKGDHNAYRDDTWFRDDHHMSPEGAERFSRAVGIVLAPMLQGDDHATVD